MFIHLLTINMIKLISCSVQILGIIYFLLWKTLILLYYHFHLLPSYLQVLLDLFLLKLIFTIYIFTVAYSLLLNQLVYYYYISFTTLCFA